MKIKGRLLLLVLGSGLLGSGMGCLGGGEEVSAKPTSTQQVVPAVEENKQPEPEQDNGGTGGALEPVRHSKWRKVLAVGAKVGKCAGSAVAAGSLFGLGAHYAGVQVRNKIDPVDGFAWDGKRVASHNYLLLGVPTSKSKLGNAVVALVKPGKHWVPNKHWVKNAHGIPVEAWLTAVATGVSCFLGATLF